MAFLILIRLARYLKRETQSRFVLPGTSAAMRSHRSGPIEDGYLPKALSKAFCCSEVHSISEEGLAAEDVATGQVLVLFAFGSGARISSFFGVSRSS
jgi:hypothetical protein